MKLQSLNGEWKLEIVGEAPYGGEKLTAAIPGSVYSALLDAGKMPDPYWRSNELDALKIMDNDFVFTRTFDLVPLGLAPGLPIFLICRGLDTICDIELNGNRVGRADNMHRRFEFDITEYVEKSGNELKLIFRSPTKYIAAKYEEVNVDGAHDAMRGFPHIRKAHCMFGWDWGPRLPDAGIWRGISIGYADRASLDSVYITQNHRDDGKVELVFDIECSGEKCCIDIVVAAPDGEISACQIDCAAFYSSASGGAAGADDGDNLPWFNSEPIVINDPQLWWPNGFEPPPPSRCGGSPLRDGGKPLYGIQITLIDKDGNALDVWERRIGLRTMTVDREKDEWGESFAIKVNNTKIFAMGADYIPQDNILSRITYEKKRRLLEDCVLANYNIIRVWGGGYYPDDEFYDICDELGILVWQDFMFACAIYELTPELEANIRAEVRDNVKRLRHHASLALWCGSNEIEWQQDMDTFQRTPKQKADYIRIFEQIIPEEVKNHDRNTFYWPSSPSSGGSFDDPNSDDRGNVHNWEVWHELKPFSEYRERYSRFVSEFGFQSFPCIETVKSYTLPEDLNIFSRVMEMHQRNGSANGRIMYYLSGSYLYPSSFENLLYASGLLQAEALRYGVEHWRRSRGRCMGTIYWQVNDIWPVASWASIDYFGRWKALHYFAKRFFAPLLLSCHETGEMTEREVPTRQPAPIKKAARLAVTNDTRKDAQGLIRWALRKPSSDIIKSGEELISVPALCALWQDELDFSDCDELSDYFSYELEADGKIVSSGSALFCRPKHYNFADPKLAIERSGDNITVTAGAFAKNVEIYGSGSDDSDDSDGSDFLLSDNFFDLNAGSYTVQILRGDPKNLKVRSVYDIGREHSK
ncbi:MAG: glycoside hydrolase family 2 protein [Oscillospiraceae bacterium]|nr:glycoside hydrolase family 2 protein [Oscillospiraceae bacterium]